jgi:tetratricopeptide (TPR) repeat protein
MCALIHGVTAGAVPVAPPADPVAEASRLRDAGDFEAAIALLEERLQSDPGDAAASLLLAETLYWTGDLDGMGAVYERAIAGHPEDVALRMAYARTLVELNRAPRAREILGPLRGSDPVAGEVETLLGTLAYWEGDLSGARTHFREALRRNPDDADARRQLDEIRALTAPWIRPVVRYESDSQPIRRWEGAAEAGWFLTPLLPATVDGTVRRDRIDGTWTRASTIRGGLRWNRPAIGLSLDARAGIFRLSPRPGSDWIGELRIEKRLQERSPYLDTSASLSEPVLVESFAGGWTRESSAGPAAAAEYRTRGFPDGNRVLSASAWFLFPLLRVPRLTFRAGYAFRYEDARESRFRTVDGAAPIEEEGPIAGVYDPHYTPERLRVHDVIGSLGTRWGRALRFQANFAWGIDAREDAPFLSAELDEDTGATVVRRGFYDRRFHPWEIGASLTVDLAPSTAVRLSGRHSRTAFYDVTGLSLDLLYRPRRPRTEDTADE